MGDAPIPFLFHLAHEREHESIDGVPGVTPPPSPIIPFMMRWARPLYSSSVTARGSQHASN